jgi:L-ascorbate metabolism protein UlaG (beta-lactamase superfamily)
VNTTLNNLQTRATFVRRYARRFIDDRVRETRTPIIAASYKPAPATWSDERVTLSWLGHATVLMNFYGTWLITDPALRSRVGVRFGGVTVGPRRMVRPALSIAELPPVDAVLVSHAHMDHCDLGTLQRFPRATRIATQRGLSDLFRRFKQVSELNWGESVEICDAKIESVKVSHWGARTLTDSHRGYGGFLITKQNRAILFGGDTAYTNAFAGLRQRAQIDLAILPIGAYDPYIHVHASPEQAWAMRAEMGAKFILPIHHSTFQLSREPVKEPITRLLTAAGTERWRVALTEPGQTWTLPEDDD